MHLSQTKGELERTLKRTGKRPVEWADKQGLLSQNTLAVHLVSVDDSDISILEKSGCLGVVCPSSQIIYESLAPISKLKSSKMKLSVATDCAASNDAADLISEIKFSSLMDKEFGSSSIDHSYWFNSVTSHPAKALGLEDTIGKISDGMAADFVFYRQSLETLPISNLVPNLIFSQSSSNVEHVMIDGQFVLFNKNPLKISTSDMEEAFLEATKEIKKRCGL
jgi:5-methylthioadenosine/S-adenosylhomocysteine deaminase